MGGTAILYHTIILESRIWAGGVFLEPTEALAMEPFPASRGAAAPSRRQAGRRGSDALLETAAILK